MLAHIILCLRYVTIVMNTYSSAHLDFIIPFFLHLYDVLRNIITYHWFSRKSPTPSTQKINSPWICAFMATELENVFDLLSQMDVQFTYFIHFHSITIDIATPHFILCKEMCHKRKKTVRSKTHYWS